MVLLEVNLLGVFLTAADIFAMRLMFNNNSNCSQGWFVVIVCWILHILALAKWVLFGIFVIHLAFRWMVLVGFEKHRRSFKFKPRFNSQVVYLLVYHNMPFWLFFFCYEFVCQYREATNVNTLLVVLCAIFDGNYPKRHSQSDMLVDLISIGGPMANRLIHPDFFSWPELPYGLCSVLVLVLLEGLHFATGFFFRPWLAGVWLTD